jgi:hypothetical protein
VCHGEQKKAEEAEKKLKEAEAAAKVCTHFHARL